MAQHRSHSTEESGKLAFLVMKHPSAYIELVENHPCDTREQLHRKEGEHIRAKECVNKVIAGRTHKEWMNETKYKRPTPQTKQIRKSTEQSRDAKAQYDKEYRAERAEELNAKKKLYYLANREKLCEYQRQRRAMLGGVLWSRVCIWKSP
jgi:hypothetical protein